MDTSLRKTWRVEHLWRRRCKGHIKSITYRYATNTAGVFSVYLIIYDCDIYVSTAYRGSQNFTSVDSLHWVPSAHLSYMVRCRLRSALHLQHHLSIAVPRRHSQFFISLSTRQPSTSDVGTSTSTCRGLSRTAFCFCVPLWNQHGVPLRLHHFYFDSHLATWTRNRTACWNGRLQWSISKSWSIFLDQVYAWSALRLIVQEQATLCRSAVSYVTSTSYSSGDVSQPTSSNFSQHGPISTLKVEDLRFKDRYIVDTDNAQREPEVSLISLFMAKTKGTSSNRKQLYSLVLLVFQFTFGDGNTFRSQALLALRQIVYFARGPRSDDRLEFYMLIRTRSYGVQSLWLSDE